MLIDGGFGVNIIIENLGIQLGLSKPNLVPYNLPMVDQNIAKLFGLIKDLKIFVHGIPYMVTFTIIYSNVLDYSYSMLQRHPWLKDAKVSHNWGTNIVTIQGTSVVRTKKLDVQTKSPEVLVCYDFHFGIFDDQENVMFATKLNMFSIGTMVVPTHIKPIPTTNYIPNIVTIKPVLRQLVKLVSALDVKLTIPPKIVKQHLPKYFFQVGEMIVDETLAWE